MAEPSQTQPGSQRSGCLSHELIIAVIGAVSTIVAAMIGLLPNWFSSPPDSDSATDSSAQANVSQVLSPTAAPSVAVTTESILVEPVAEGEYMVLVAQLEPIGAGTDPTRFVVDNLQRALQDEIPFSRTRVRPYPEVISSAEAAQAIAQKNGATVVVWGSYEDQQVDLNVHIGVTDDFTLIKLSRDILEHTANIRLRLNNPREESAAVAVLVALNVLHNADGSAYELLRTLAALKELKMAPADVTGNSVAARVNRYFLNYFDNTATALTEIEAAIELDPNPLLYTYRGAARFRTGLAVEAGSDMETARLKGPPGWTSPLIFIATARAFVGPVNTTTISATLPMFNQIIEQRPNDWFVLYMRGTANYYIGNWAQAEADLMLAINLRPDLNGPHATATLLTLRQGRVASTRWLVADARKRFTNPAFGNRVINAFYGDLVPNLNGPILAAFGNLLIVQPATAVENVDAALQVDPNLPDLYFLKGFAQCNLGQHAAAEAAYTRALELAPEFALLYLLRAEARMQQGNIPAAQQDLMAAAASTQAPELADLITIAQAGQLSCKTLLTN